MLRLCAGVNLVVTSPCPKCCLLFWCSPEEVEGFVLQHQAAVACQVQLMQGGRQGVRQQDLSQLITTQVYELQTHTTDNARGLKQVEQN